ncbi:MAG: hypothetical protein DPW14_10510 [Planctomycetes bacterium]|nr:hypothetical protein [Planctomycetota bacterium]
MRKAQQFVEWWQLQRVNKTSLYPDPKSIAREANCKSPDALMIEFENRWPEARQDVLKLLEKAKTTLRQPLEVAVREVSAWAAKAFAPDFVDSVANALTEVRKDAGKLHSMASIFRDHQTSSGVSAAATKQFMNAGGEARLAEATPLRERVNGWLRECLTFYRSEELPSLRRPPLLWTLRPQMPWHEPQFVTRFDKLDPGTRPPVCGVLTRGAFLAPWGHTLHVVWSLDDPSVKGCEEVYEFVLRAGTVVRFDEFPKSVLKLSEAASINRWCIAVTLDKCFGAITGGDVFEARDWLAQVQVAFDSWVKTRMGKALEVYEGDFGPYDTNAPLVRDVAGCFSKPRGERPLAMCAFLIGFALDAILDYWLQQSPTTTQALPSRPGAQRQGGREGQVMVLVRDHPDWKKAKIARHLGIRRDALSRGKLKAAFDRATAMNRQNRPKGSAAKDGRIEAAAEEE